MENINEKKINDLKNDNEKKRKQIDEFEESIKKLKTNINKNYTEIQNLCEHKWNIDSCYGERTSYECQKCGLCSRTTSI